MGRELEIMTDRQTKRPTDGHEGSFTSNNNNKTDLVLGWPGVGLDLAMYGHHLALLHLLHHTQLNLKGNVR